MYELLCKRICFINCHNSSYNLQAFDFNDLDNGKAAYNGLEVIYDANTTLQPGIYVCNNETENTPASHGFLTVKAAYNGAWIIQEFYHVGTGESPNIYKRSYVNSTWSNDWEQTATKDDLTNIYTEYNVANNNVLFRCTAEDGSAIQLATTGTQIQLQKRTSSFGSFETVWAK